MNRRRILAAALAISAASASLALVPISPAAAAVGAPRFLQDVPGAKFQWSSPAIGNDLVVVGGMNGTLYGYGPDGRSRFATPLGAPIASSPAMGDINGDGAQEIVVGYGSEVAGGGGVAVLNLGGGMRCKFDTPARSDGLSGVFNSPAIGDVNGDGTNDIVFGSFNDRIYAMNGSCGVIAQFNNQDTVWSAPALRDVDGDGSVEIFIGGDATVPGQTIGGYFRSLEFDGSATLRQRWVRTALETFQSGVAFANLGGQLSVVTGSGADYCRNQNQASRCNTESNKVWAFDPNSGNDIAAWPKQATFQTFLGGPAVGDVNGDGGDDIVIASTNYRAGGGGAVDAFLSDGGRWTYRSGDEIPSSPIIVDTTGAGTPEVVVGTNGQLFVLNGPDGRAIQSGIAAGDWAHKSAPAAGVLGGTWVLATAGFNPTNDTGKIGVYGLPSPSSAPWPQFQKNVRRLGSESTDPAPISCSSGYWLVAADGGIFSFGNAPFFGSTGDITLNQQIVGMTATPDRGGYQFVARDGGIFSFGNAGFFGSTGGTPLNKPIVGMAPTPSGKGYWLVASDGGIFTFGDATFFGSSGGSPLNQPIVGMASTPSGKGYWLVARDGGIFSFGDAEFLGSTGAITLNQPIVGMAAHPSGKGYWFVASDGGIFTFGTAPFLGSTGDLRLNKPVVGMRATPSGKGYWFVATDGGIFSFGDAEFCGSTGAITLNKPIVGMG